MQPIDILTDQLKSFAAQFWAILPQLGIALVVVLATWGLARLGAVTLARALRRLQMRRSLIGVFQMLATSGIWLAGIMIATTIAFPTVTPGKLITAVGLGSIAIGFAFKDIFENFIAGILILLREPFRLGDYIECAGLEGQVEEITVRDTHIRQTDGQRVVMPNAMLFKEPVTVLTDRDVRRTTIVCGIAYGEDVDRARDVIRAAVEGQANVRGDQPVQIFAQAFNSSSIDFEVTWWTGSRPIDIRRSRDEVVAAVKRALDEAGIEIPFPYRTLTFKDPIALRNELPDREAAEQATERVRAAPR